MGLGLTKCSLVKNKQYPNPLGAIYYIGFVSLCSSIYGDFYKIIFRCMECYLIVNENVFGKKSQKRSATDCISTGLVYNSSCDSLRISGLLHDGR